MTFRLSTQSTISSSAGTAGVAGWALQPGNACLTCIFAGGSYTESPFDAVAENAEVVGTAEKLKMLARQIKASDF